MVPITQSWASGSLHSQARFRKRFAQHSACTPCSRVAPYWNTRYGTLPGLACLLYPASVSRHASPSRGSPPPLLFLILPFYSVSTDLFWPAFCSRQSIAIFPYARHGRAGRVRKASSPHTRSSLFGLAGSFCSGLRCGHPPCALAYVRTADIAEATNGHLRRLCRGAVRGIFLGTASRHHFQEKRTLLLTRRTLVLDRSTK